MNTPHSNAIALAIMVAFSAGALAEGMTKDAYKEAKEKCDSYSGAAKESCLSKAKEQFKK